MKLQSLLIASALLFSTSLFAEVAGGNSGSGNTTQVAGGTVNSANGLYTVTVSPDKKTTTVAALDGEVTLTRADGTSVKIDIGSGRVIGADGKETTQTLAEIVAAEKAAGNTTGGSSVTASLAAALKVAADNTAAGKYGDGATTILASLVKVLATANPDAVAEYVSTAVSGVVQSPLATNSSPYQAIIEAARRAVPAALDAITDAASNAADAVAVTNTDSGARGHILDTVRQTIMSERETYNLEQEQEYLNSDPILGNPVNNNPVIASTTPITPVDPTVITVSPSGGNGTTQ